MEIRKVGSHLKHVAFDVLVNNFTEDARTEEVVIAENGLMLYFLLRY